MMMKGNPRLQRAENLLSSNSFFVFHQLANFSQSNYRGKLVRFNKLRELINFVSSDLHAWRRFLTGWKQSSFHDPLDTLECECRFVNNFSDLHSTGSCSGLPKKDQETYSWDENKNEILPASDAETDSRNFSVLTFMIFRFFCVCSLIFWTFVNEIKKKKKEENRKSMNFSVLFLFRSNRFWVL